MEKIHAALGSTKSAGLMVLGTLVTVILGATMRGDWLMIFVTLNKHFKWYGYTTVVDEGNSSSVPQQVPVVRENLFENVHLFVPASLVVSFLTYYGLSGFFQYYYYIKRREQSEEWKCQPNKFLTPENERHEILLGSFNMFLGGTISGIIATWVINGGYNTLYFSPLERGWLYLILSTVAVFIFDDFMAFLLHKLFHIPYLYKRVHKIHHRYHQPTAFSATAMHPMEFLMYQVVMAVTAFVVPIYAGAFIGILLYQYYYGLCDHSGVKLDALWPWQPSSKFHDDHHKYFHCNFGFNCDIWDRMWDTLRRDDRVYSETVWAGGHGVKATNAKVKATKQS